MTPDPTSLQTGIKFMPKISRYSPGYLTLFILPGIPERYNWKLPNSQQDESIMQIQHVKDYQSVLDF